ncbi:lipase 3-like [Diorhabda sublineata]|uniref:lipase 3-like n=1 Tax=Diorhabda sublineata TaxID=1163346 RepID=UPI0024E1526A|nr:lipase 3-like [Diorhabda sublineata]
MNLVIFNFFFVISNVYVAGTSKNISGDVFKFDLTKFVNGLGYQMETHNIDTEDGYKLECHRVSITKYANTDKPVVLLWHGFLGSSADFFHIGTGKSLPLRLADEGYDVWVGNNRGNSWGRQHKTLNPDTDEEFWDFSLDELALYDVSSTIDYILKITGNDRISFIGHSTGASQFFILTSTRPEYNEKIKVMAALAPVVYMNHTTNLLLNFVNPVDYPAILAAEKSLNLTEILPHLKILNTGLDLVCRIDKIKELCSAVLFFLTGFDKTQITQINVRNLFRSFPAGTSTKNLNHFLQLKLTGNFARYDYGKIKNLDIYDSIDPPSYNLSAISVPIGIYYGENDLIVSLVDTERLIEDLPNVIEDHIIDYKRFSHLGFLIADNTDDFVNYYVINTLNKYNDKEEITSSSSTTTEIPTTQSTSSTTTAGVVRNVFSGYLFIIPIIVHLFNRRLM